MEKRRGTGWALLLLFLASAAMLLLCNLYMENYVTVGGKPVLRNVEYLCYQDDIPENPEQLAQLKHLKTLDLRGTGITAEQYLSVNQALPDCEILWSVPFQGDYVDMDTPTLRIGRLTEEDLDQMVYFTALQTLDARGCRDYGPLRELMQARPELNVIYDMEISGKTYLWDTREMELADPDADLLEELLPMLPELERITFTGKRPEDERIRNWMAEYPDVVFDWQFEVCGVAASSLDTELILNDIPMESVEEVETALGNFHNLQWVEMCNCGISSEEMDALSQRHPDIRFVWTIKVRFGTLRTDAIAFIPYKLGYHIGNPLYDSDCTELKYCTDLICLDMGHMKVRDISFLEHMPNMKYLILGDTPVKDFTAIAGLKELIYLEIFNVQFTQHELLLGLNKLEDLNLGSTPTNDIAVLKQMTWLKRLWVPGTRLNGFQYDELVQSLPDTQVVIYARHSTDKGWRDNQNYRDMRDLLGMWYMQ